jgi:hypothetical protein
MEEVYFACAIVGGTLIVCQFLLTLVGLGGGHDLGGGDHVDAGGHVDPVDHGVEHATESTHFVGLLTFRTLSAAAAFFGLTGVIGQNSGVAPVLGLLMAIAAGAAAVYLVGWTMKLLVRLNMDGTINIDRAAGCEGTVYLPIPGGKTGQGKVLVSVMSRTMEYKAIARDPLPTGAPITVVSVIGSDTVEVAPKQA